LSTAAPEPGEEVVIDGRPARVTAVDAEAQTFCVMFVDDVNEFGHGSRRHDISVAELAGQQWSCDFTDHD
jgi:hypothetical protein